MSSIHSTDCQFAVCLYLAQKQFQVGYEDVKSLNIELHIPQSVYLSLVCCTIDRLILSQPPVSIYINTFYVVLVVFFIHIMYVLYKICFRILLYCFHVRYGIIKRLKIPIVSWVYALPFLSEAAMVQDL